MTFTIGDEPSNQINVTVLRYEYPNNSDIWDGNWLVCDIAVTAGPLSGRAKAGFLTTAELRDFLKDLRALLKTEQDDIELKPTEPFLTLTLSRSPRGAVAKGTFYERPVVPPCIQFDFQVSRDSLERLEEQLVRVTNAFPVRNEPVANRESGKKSVELGNALIAGLILIPGYLLVIYAWALFLLAIPLLLLETFEDPSPVIIFLDILVAIVIVMMFLKSGRTRLRRWAREFWDQLFKGL